jgi:type I restriction enzyme S subunit
MGYGRWIDGEYAFVSEDKARSLSANIARPGDIVFTQRGTLGQVAIVPDSGHERYVVSQSQMKLTPNEELVDALFLYYQFIGPEQQAYIEAHKIQTGVPHTNLGILRNTPLLIPPLPEQRAIAHILGTLDDKIELNRRMNRTLEAMARALFQSWFVDFDPVRTKQRGEAPPGLTPELAALFPDRLVETEVGLAPEGWGVGRLGDVVDHPRRSLQPHQISTEAPYIALEHMPRRCIALSDWGTANGVESNKFEFRTGEILFGKLRPYFHKVGVAPVNGVCSTDIVVLKPNNEQWFGFALGHASSEAFVDYTNAFSAGTKMPRTNWNDMARYPVVVPSVSVAEAFTEQVQPLVTTRRSLDLQCKSKKPVKSLSGQNPWLVWASRALLAA